MSVRVVRALSPIEALRVQLLEARIETLAAQQETLRAAEKMLRAQFGLEFEEVWRRDPDGTGYQVITAVPEPEAELEAPDPAAPDAEVTDGD